MCFPAFVVSWNQQLVRLQRRKEFDSHPRLQKITNKNAIFYEGFEKLYDFCTMKLKTVPTKTNNP
jgi:hypothetical protein